MTLYHLVVSITKQYRNDTLPQYHLIVSITIVYCSYVAVLGCYKVALFCDAPVIYRFFYPYTSLLFAEMNMDDWTLIFSLKIKIYILINSFLLKKYAKFLNFFLLLFCGSDINFCL